MPLWRAARNFQMPPKIIPNAATRSLIIYHSDLTGEVVPHTFISARNFLQTAPNNHVLDIWKEGHSLTCSSASSMEVVESLHRCVSPLAP